LSFLCQPFGPILGGVCPSASLGSCLQWRDWLPVSAQRLNPDGFLDASLYLFWRHVLKFASTLGQFVQYLSPFCPLSLPRLERCLPTTCRGASTEYGIERQAGTAKFKKMFSYRAAFSGRQFTSLR